MSGRDGRRGPWRVHGLSVEGYRHLRGGVPCQDAWHCAVTGPARDPVTVLAVADGAGSRPCSDKGAELATRLATTHFGRRATPAFPGADAVHDQLRAAFHDVREAFLRQTGDDADDYATTLTVVVLAATWVGHLSVGDGFVVLRAGVEDGRPQFHLLPQADAPSEYSNETVFITTANAESWLRTACVRDYAIDGVLLSTDGLAQIALSWRDGRPERPNESFAAAVFRSIDSPGHDPAGDDAALAELLRSDRFTAINADDKTLLRAVRR